MAQILHTMFRVTDLKRSVDFYTSAWHETAKNF